MENDSCASKACNSPPSVSEDQALKTRTLSLKPASVVGQELQLRTRSRTKRMNTFLTPGPRAGDFFPNNDIHPARKFRITKAKSLGATWIRKWNSQAGKITHVVLDLAVSYHELLDHLRVPEGIPAHVIVVNEKYIPDCISFKALVDPHQARYHVLGMPERFHLKSKSDPAAVGESMLHSASIEIPEQSAMNQGSFRLSAKRRASGSPVSEFRLASDEPSSVSAQHQGLDKHNPNLCKVGLVGSNKKAPLYGDDLVRIITDVSAYSPQALGFIQDDSDDEDSKEDLGGMAHLKRFQPAMGTSSGNSTLTQSSPRTSPTQRVQDISTTASASKDSFSNFACMQMHETNARTKVFNPNARTIAVLQQMHDYYDCTRDQWRTLAYRKAISSLKMHSARITTREEAQQLPFIGPSLAIKIEEIAWTNRLRQLGHAQSSPWEESLHLFLGIYGIGLSQARRWIAKGLRTLDDLRNDEEVFTSLSDSQRVGLERYHDFQLRIPRHEVAQHAKVVEQMLKKIDPDATMRVMGSYRRGAETCGDIDILISKEGATTEDLKTLLHDCLVPQLTESGFLKAALVGGGTGPGRRGLKWFGASVLPQHAVAADVSARSTASLSPTLTSSSSTTAPAPSSPPSLFLLPWRRIDFLIVPPEELGAAKLYFTGNDIFNRSMRLLASKKGMRLGQHGLFTNVMRGPKRLKVTVGTLVEARSEDRIFEILGVTWRPPEHRSC